MLSETLQSLGFAEKEARVYLKALELGATSAHALSEETAIPRATVYLQINALLKRGLIAQYEKDGKTLYRAAPPERLAELYHAELQDFQRKETAVQEILPNLKALDPAARLPKVRLFEGLAGLEDMRAELLKHRNIEWYSITGADAYHASVPEERRRAQYENLWKNSNRCKAIISSAALPRQDIPAPIKYLYERYLVPADKYPVPGEVAIFGNTVALLSYTDEPIGILVENPDLARTLRTLFQLAFERSKMFTRLDVGS